MTKKPTEKYKNLHRSTDLGYLLVNYNSMPIDNAIAALQEAKKEGHEKLYFEAEVDGYDAYLGGVRWIASHKSDETDEEFEARVAQWEREERVKREEAKKRKAARDEQDHKEWLRLQKKFGKEV